MHANALDREPATSAKMQFVLMGYDQDAGVRLYAFQGVIDGRRTSFTVSVNLALLPSYGIRIQELPLLCRGVLERRVERVEGEEKRTLTLTEAEMRVHADSRAAARETADRKRKPARRPPDDNTVSAWRLPPR